MKNVGLKIKHMFTSGYNGQVLGKHQSLYGTWIQMTWPELFMLEWTLADNRDITRIVELGTGHGALTLFFGLHMSMRGGKVLSFDIKKIVPPQWYELSEKLNITFEQADVFTSGTVEKVREFIKDGRALIFCDDGDKKREFPLYARVLKKNDLIMAHDWGPIDLSGMGWGVVGGEIRHEHLDQKTLSMLEVYRQQEFLDLKARILSMRRK